MYQKILVALALDQGYAEKAMQLAQLLKAEGGKIIALHVVDQAPGHAKYFMSDLVDDKKIQEWVEQKMAERIAGEPDVEPVMLKGHPGREIVAYAEKIGADCIITGSHKPGLTDYLIGSTSARVVRHAPCSVHVLR